jgi:hypothetical protein
MKSLIHGQSVAVQRGGLDFHEGSAQAEFSRVH